MLLLSCMMPLVAVIAQHEQEEQQQRSFALVRELPRLIALMCTIHWHWTVGMLIPSVTNRHACNSVQARLFITAH